MQPFFVPVRIKLLKSHFAILFWLVFIFFFQTTLAQVTSSPPEAIKLLTKQHQQFQHDKIHLHLDKSEYTSRDTIWLACYLVKSGIDFQNDASRIVFIDLLDQKGNLLQKQLLQVNSGFASGSLILPQLPDGQYLLKAYTNLMMRLEENFIVNTSFTVRNSIRDLRIKAPKASSDIDLSFFPESGHLVEGLTSVVGYNISEAPDYAFPIEGKIVDESDVTVTHFKTGNGEGTFQLCPAPGKAYTAKIKFASGQEKQFTLPKALKSGYLISANTTDPDSLHISLQATADLSKEQVLFFPHSNGLPLFYMNTNFTHQQVRISIPRYKLPAGVIHLVLLDSNQNLLAEQAVFNPNQTPVRIQATNLKAVYGKGEQTTLNLQAINSYGKPITGNFSVSIVQEKDSLRSENATIFDDLLINAEVDSNAQYIHRHYPDPNQFIFLLKDNRFAWYRINSQFNAELRFNPDEIDVYGKVTAAAKINLNKLPITLLIGNLLNGALQSTYTDSTGRFSFSIPDSLKNLPLRIQVNTKKKTPYTISLTNFTTSKASNFDASEIELASKQSTYRSAEIQTTKNQTALSKTKALKEVQIFGRKPRLINSHSDNLNGPGNADQVFTPEQLEKMADLSQLSSLLIGVIPDSRGSASMSLRSNVGTHTPNVLVLVDGMDGLKSLTEISPRDIESIEFLKNIAYTGIYGIRGSGGVLLITTKRGNYQQNSAAEKSANTFIFNLPAVSSGIKFQNTGIISNQKSGLEQTLYWKPDVLTDQNGQAQLQFQNGNIPGQYKITIEGIGTKGVLCRQVFFYQVE